VLTESSSPALLLFNLSVQESLFRAGHFFDSAPDGLTAHLPRLLTQHGGRRVQVQTHAYSLLLRAGTPEGDAFAQDVERAMQTLRAFITKWSGLSPDYSGLVQQVQHDLHEPDFTATWKLLTAWAIKQDDFATHHE
jgi:hypothetical protein